MKQALIVYGGWPGHDPKGVAALFADILEKEGVGVTLSDTLEAFDGDLSGYDLIVPIWTMGEISPSQCANVMKAVANGAGLAGCHGGMCDAFRGCTDWQFMTGAQWVAHPGNAIDYRVTLRHAGDSPLTRGISDFDVHSEQYYILVDPCVNVLAVTEYTHKDGLASENGVFSIPVVYTKTWGKGRVYYNSLGHDHTLFENIPEAAELMRRGFLWAMREVEA